MDMDIETIKNNMKNKRKINDDSNNNQSNFLSMRIYSLIIRTMVCIVIMLVVLIGSAKSIKFKTKLYEYVYDKNISFSYINELYKKYFGSPLPFIDLFKEKTKPVFKEQLTYLNKEEYNNGVRLTVGSNYLVPSLSNGIVIFIGKKDNIGNCVIIQQSDAVDAWYCNIDNVNVSMYDYIEKGFFIGESIGDTIDLYFKKDGKVVAYDKYI